MLACYPEDETISSKCTIDGFDITIRLQCDSSVRSKEKDDEYSTYVLDRATVTVAKDEVEAPPEVIPDGQGRRDYRVQSEYFKGRIKEYGSVAREALNRLIRFFKFQLYTPYIQEFPEKHNAFQNAEWTDSEGREAGKGGVSFIVKGIPGQWGQLGVQKLRLEDKESLNAALQKPFQPQLHEEIISDAQTALFEGNLRRSVLELAIACEIAVKRSFFSGDSPAGAAFEYFENKSMIKVTVLNLVNRVAQEVFGRSFKEDHLSDFTNIDHLFRCRNKVAHRGDLSFRADSGPRQSVSYETVADWWLSVQNLLGWLQELKDTSVNKV